MRIFRPVFRSVVISSLLLATPLLQAMPALSQTQSDAGEDRLSQEEYDMRVDFPAVILRDLGQDDVEVRGGNGHIYRVRLTARSDRFEVGVGVRVVGIADDLNVKGAYLVEDETLVPPIKPIRYQDAVDIDFPAHISGIDKKRDRAIVKGDDGKDYRLRGDDVEDFQVGDYVRVQGVSRYGVVELRDLDLIP